MSQHARGSIWLEELKDSQAHPTLFCFIISRQSLMISWCSPGWSGIMGTRLALTQRAPPSKCWHWRCVPSHPVNLTLKANLPCWLLTRSNIGSPSRNGDPSRYNHVLEALHLCSVVVAGCTRPSALSSALGSKPQGTHSNYSIFLAWVGIIQSCWIKGLSFGGSWGQTVVEQPFDYWLY